MIIVHLKNNLPHLPPTLDISGQQGRGVVGNSLLILLNNIQLKTKYWHKMVTFSPKCFKNLNPKNMQD